MGPGITACLEGIDATVKPFNGRFIIHGDPPERLEGAWHGDLIVIAFPDLKHARDWYRSDAYQQIPPLRTENSTGDIFLIERGSRRAPRDRHSAAVAEAIDRPSPIYKQRCQPNVLRNPMTRDGGVRIPIRLRRGQPVVMPCSSFQRCICSLKAASA